MVVECCDGSTHVAGYSGAVGCGGYPLASIAVGCLVGGPLGAVSAGGGPRVALVGAAVGYCLDAPAKGLDGWLFV